MDNTRIPPAPPRKEKNEYMKWWRKYKQSEEQKKRDKEANNKRNKERYQNDRDYREKKKEYIRQNYKPSKPPITVKLENGSHKCNACDITVKNIKQHIITKKHLSNSANY